MVRPTRLDRGLFDGLTAFEGEDLISWILPTHQSGPEIEADRIRLKNLISATEERLEAAGWKPREREVRLARPREILDDREFWRHQGEGLAVFVDGDGTPTFVRLLEHDGPETTVIAPNFHIRHLLPSLEVLTFTVVALTMGSVSAFRAGRDTIEPLDLDLPGSMSDVNWFVDREAQLQRHSEGSGTARQHHGHDPADRRDEDIDRFLRAISEHLDSSGPLIALGDDRLVARFEDLTRQSLLSPPNSGLTGDYDQHDVHGRAAPIIEAEEEAMSAEVAKDAVAILDEGSAIVDLEEALRAATTGRLSTLVLRRWEPPVWGTWEAASLEATRRANSPHLGDGDLLDRLVVMADGTGARVRTVTEDLAGHSFIASRRF